MPSSRRRFLTTSTLSAAVLATGRGLDAGAVPPAQRLPGLATPTVARAATPLSLLIIGGTGFSGPDAVEYALARGHKVTLLNRNRTRPDLFKGAVDQIIGDLNGDVSALQGRSFDAVLDIPTTFPFWVRNVGQYLTGRVKHYTYISTLSVYGDDSAAWKDETDTTTPMPPNVDPYDITPAHAGRYYGALKTYSEQEVQKTYPGAALIIRPGLIVGPLDRSDRFTYWPVRIDRGGEVLAPGEPTDPVQLIDARDLMAWTIRMIEARETGVFNATGPGAPLSMGELLYGIKAITTSGAQFTWVNADFLREQTVAAWRDMPVWVPPKGRPGFSQRSVAKAVAKGLTFRPLAETARATLDWHTQRPAAERQALADGKIAGIAAEREAAVLAAWKRKRATS